MLKQGHTILTCSRGFIKSWHQGLKAKNYKEGLAGYKLGYKWVTLIVGIRMASSPIDCGHRPVKYIAYLCNFGGHSR